MGSTFGSYGIATSGLRVNQAALTVVSNNLSNVNTTGYSRQRISMVETSNGTSLGMGANVESITRARNTFLDKTYRNENTDAGYWTVKSGDLEYMQEIVNEYEYSSDDETTKTSLQTLLEDFFDSWSDVATDPSDQSSREIAVSSAVSLVEALSDMDAQLRQLQEDACDRIGEGVDTLNSLAQQVADLNEQIMAGKINGGEVSYLEDARDSLIDEMSNYAQLTVTTYSDGNVTVSIGGINLVNEDKVKELVVSGTGSVSDPVTISWADTGQKADISSGTLGAYLEESEQVDLDALDGTDLPYNFTTGSLSEINTMRQALNTMITTVAVTVNSLCTSGTDLNGDTGIAFFTKIDDSQPLSISNIQVNPELLEDDGYQKVVASSNGSEGDNTIANAIYALQDEELFQFNGTSMNIATFYSTFTSWLGTAADDANSSYDTQAALVSSVDSARQEVSSVSLDEEMANMVQFQNAYAASARVLSAIDSLIGDMIDQIGG
ncbi:hypothetical protein P22_2358 [Propionispora sp. 2/2-37]|uniref:flagellar hook-associated protein FlgK n=1 Tax=Propionispora sp. 2/2-37 TaxID=1677858 RepID=UPI0006BB91B0|nr:flagellar hook-associated protein FlgK [Propionispora sp. 2/2-37]CUH96268.1 hypothetical protein P22_2358 [Propionispora sp. 2/2-37]